MSWVLPKTTDTCHVLVQVGQLLDLFLSRRTAMRILRDVKFVDIGLKAMEFIERRLYLLASKLLGLCLLGAASHNNIYQK